MAERVTFDLKYEPWPGNHSHCQVTAIGLPALNGSDNALTVLVVSEARDNEGMSVTNAADLIATLVAKQLRLDPHRVLWVEHYPVLYKADQEIHEETFDLVTFEWVEQQAGFPRWFPVSRRWVEELIKEPFVGS